MKRFVCFNSEKIVFEPKIYFMLTMSCCLSLYRPQIIKKSRFLSRATPASSFAEAQTFLRDVGDLKASHNCWAWRSVINLLVTTSLF